MSGYGPGILGATIRRTCGPTSSSFSTAARHHPHPIYPSRGAASCRLLPTTKRSTIHLPFSSIVPRNAANVSNKRTPTGNIRRLDTTSGLKVESSICASFPARSRLVLSMERNPQSPGTQTLRKHCVSRAVFEPQNKPPAEKVSLSLPKSGANLPPKSTEFPRATTGPNPGKHLIGRLPNINHIHRPSKEELLAAATGFWSRLKVRFKWFSIRSGRPFNIDEIGAFFSWVLLGHVLWIVLGTTTFFSLAILAVNTVFAQGQSLRTHERSIITNPNQRHWLGGSATI